jgi:anti-sigma factor RsiW
MTHAEAEAQFAAYNEGKLDRETTRAFHQHLKGCEACQSRVRLQNLVGKSKGRQASNALTSPETQAAIARNRDLLIKILLLLVLGWAVARIGKG